jgi:hypothetical protein
MKKEQRILPEYYDNITGQSKNLTRGNLEDKGDE